MTRTSKSSLKLTSEVYSCSSMDQTCLSRKNDENEPVKRRSRKANNNSSHISNNKLSGPHPLKKKKTKQSGIRNTNRIGACTDQERGRMMKKKEACIFNTAGPLIEKLKSMSSVESVEKGSYVLCLGYFVTKID